MDINRRKYKVIFDEDCIQEMEDIYKYINKKLYAPNAARNLMIKTQMAIKELEYNPKSYKIILPRSRASEEHRRILVNNYVLIYTILEEENIVYISHMFYAKSDYLNGLY